jgi:hypothetical protein
LWPTGQRSIRAGGRVFGTHRTIKLKITPASDGAAGTVVHGTLYVDVFAAFNESAFGGIAGSDVIAIPYEYRIG